MQDEIKEKITKLVEEQDKQKGGAFGGVYGTYKLNEADCGRALAYFKPVDGDCRMVGVKRVDSVDGYWKTTWKTEDTVPATIEVTYNASGDVNLAQDYSEKIIAQHGPEGTTAGWHWMNSSYNTKFDLVVRSTLNSLRVRNMKLRKGGDVYMLCGAHRLNFVYHQEKSLSADKCWGASTYDDGSLLDKMRANGLATPVLFDPLGLVWLLLWKKDNLSAASGSDPSSYYMCAAYMHPHFADLIVGTLPEKYNVCTATRWWNKTEDKNNWLYNNDPNLALDPTAIRAQMDQETDWVADKIRKPFFKLNDGEVELGPEVARALYAEESRAGTTRPLKWLIDVLKYVYFNKQMPVITTKPVPVVTAAITAAPAGPPPPGSSVTTTTGGPPAPPGSSAPPAPPGSSVTTTTTTIAGPVGPLVPPGPVGPLVPPEGTGTPAPTVTGTPAPTGTGTEESWLDKNKYILIGIGIGIFVLFIIGVLIYVAMKKRKRSDDDYAEVDTDDGPDETNTFGF
jgi:hypothetical protein